MKKLSRAAAYFAILCHIISPAYATSINTDTTDNIVLNAGDLTLSIATGGNVTAADLTSPTVFGSSVSGFTVNVDSGNGGDGINSLSSTNSSIYFTDALANINIVSGRIDGLVAGNSGTIFLENSRAGTNNVTIDEGTLLQNRWGGGGVALNYDNSVNDAELIVINSGSIAVDIGATSADIRFNDSSGGSTMSFTNTATGNVSDSGNGMSFNLVNGGAVTISNRGAINGDIASAVASLSLQNLGSGIINSDINITSGTAAISNNNTGVINGNLALTNGSTTIDINDSSQFNGNITGATSNLDITISGALARISGDINLGTNSSSSLGITDGTLAGNFTFANTAQLITLNGTARMGGAILGTGNIDIGQTAGLELNGGTVTSIINGTSAGAGTLLIGNGQSVTVAANIGGSRALGVISLRPNASLNLNSGNRSLSATNVYFDSGSTLTVGSGAINATMRGASNGVGSVNFTANNSLNKDVGVMAFSMANVSLSSGVALNAGSHNIQSTNITLNSLSSLTSSGDIIGNVSMATGSNLNLGNGATLGLSYLNTVNSAVTSGFGTITTTSGTQTINSDIGQILAISAFNVGSGSNVEVIGNISATNIGLGGIMNLRAFGGNNLAGTMSGNGSGTLALNSATHNLTGTLNMSENDTISTAILDTTTAGQIIVSGAATNDAGIFIKVALGSAETDIGSVYTLISGGTDSALNVVADSNINVDGSGTNHIGKYAFNSLVSGNDLLLSVSRYYVPVTMTDPSAADPYKNIIGDDISTTGELAKLRDYLDSYATDAQKMDALKSALLENDNSRSRTIFDNINLAAGLIGNRLDSIKSPGRSSGDDEIKNAVWAQGFGLSANQRSGGGYDGYAANTSGFGVGIDKTCENGFTVGLAAIYAHTKIKSSYSAKKTDMDNYGLNLYAGKSFDNFFINGLIGMGFNQYNSERRIGIISASAQADYNGKSYVARAEIGSNMKFANELIFTPTLMVTAAKNTMESYTEGGAGTLNIHVNNQDVNFLETRVGSALSKNFRISQKNILTPTVFLSYGYDFAGDRQKATANFAGQTATFANTAAKIAQGSLRAGFGAKLYNVNDASLSAEYSYDHRVGYNSHMGSLRLRYSF